MSFDRNAQPDAITYHASQGSPLSAGKWGSRHCPECDSSSALRVLKATGSFCCMACGMKGGDTLAFHMRLTGLGFIEAAKELGCWVEDGKPETRTKATTLPVRQALQVLSFEATLTAIAAGNLAHGVALTDADRARLLKAANRINRLVEEFA